MEIAVYVSKHFANENTPLFKPIDFEERHIYEKSYNGQEERITQDFLRLDTSSKTTLKKLYEDGYVIKNITNPHGFWHYFFLEKNLKNLLWSIKLS